MTEKDRKEAAAIEKRRCFEEERKKRIFNPRARILGVDKSMLEKQIAERKQQEEQQKQIDKIFKENLIKADQIAVAFEAKEREERQKIQLEINKYRQNYQRPEDRREFDLNDPNYKKKLLPARVDDNDPRCGPASAQKFEGEDLVSDQRTRIQREQIKAWLDQQMQEKEEADKQRRMAEEAYVAAVIARDQRVQDLEKMEKMCKKQLQEACQRFNKALASERTCEREKQKKQIMDDNMAEIYNNITSDLLTENREVSQSNMGPDKKITSQYKGMTEAELKEILNAQKAQIEESKERKLLEKRLEHEFNEYINGTQRSIYLMDLEVENKKKQMAKNLAEENRLMAEEQRKQRDYLNKIVYRNQAADEFFDQFNRTTR